MGCDTRAKLIGSVSESEIASFLANNFNCRASYIGVEEKNYGKKSEMSIIQESYDNSEYWLTVSGPIVLEFLGKCQKLKEQNTRTVFYIRDNVNFHENLALYEAEGLGEMVRARTTHVSMNSDIDGITIVKSLVDEFGGWFTENDCDDHYVRIYGRRENIRVTDETERADLIVEVETITGALNSPISRIRAIRTNIGSGKVYDVFDKQSSKDGGATALLRNFCDWISEIQKELMHVDDLYIWSNNGYLGDSILRNFCLTFGIKYPVSQHNSRCIETLYDVVTAKMGYANTEVCRDDIRKKISFDNVNADMTEEDEISKMFNCAYKMLLNRK